MPRGLGLKVCAFTGCAELSSERYCPTHRPVVAKRSHSEFRALYSSRRWRIFRKRILRRDRYRCKWPEEKCTTWASEVDHVVPLTEWPGSPFDERNVQSLCKHHHSVKTAAEVLRRDA